MTELKRITQVNNHYTFLFNKKNILHPQLQIKIVKTHN